MRAFHCVEVSSRCNLRCRYCPQPKMKREKVDMTPEVFAETLRWLKRFGQAIVHLHNFGESTLNPHLPEYVARTRAVVPQVRLSTNGVGVTAALVGELKDAGLSELTVSIHRPEVAQEVIAWAQEAGLRVDLGSGPLAAPHDWAGQVDTPASSLKFDCHFIGQQKGVVLADGRVATCCIDAEGISAEATVWDDLLAVELRPFSLCEKCHHVLPAKYRVAAGNGVKP